jgi:hypothetical protein
MFSTRCYFCIHAGPVKTTFAGIYIGKGTGMKNFNVNYIYGEDSILFCFVLIL